MIAMLLMLFNLSLMQDSVSTNKYVMKEVIVEAIRGNEDTPISQKIMTDIDIEKNNFGQEMAYQISRTPSISYQSDNGLYNGYSYMRLRGVDQTRINFTLNGMPLNEPEDQGAYFSNYADFASNIQSLQIQRGVGTSTTGTASYIGSVNFQFKPLSDSIFSIELGHGSYNSQRVSAVYSSGINNNLAFYTRGSLLKSDGYKYNSGTKSKSVFLGTGYFSKKDIIQLISFYGRTDMQLSYLATSSPDIDIDPRTNYLTEDERDRFSQFVIQLQYQREFNSDVNFSLQTYYNKVKGNYIVNYMDFMNFHLNSDWYGATSILSSKIDNLKLNTGISAYSYGRLHSMKYSKLDDNGNDNLYSNKGNKYEINSFVKMSYNINSLNIYTDLQYRHILFKYSPNTSYNLFINDISWNFFNPKFGVTYDLDENISVYSSIGTMHREPTRSDMFAGYDDIDTVNVSEIGNFHSVMPEMVVDIEIGTNVNLDNVVLQANLYNMDFTNEIAAIGPLSYIGLPLRKNVPSSIRRGMEVDIRYLISKSLTMSQNFTYNYSIIHEYNTEFDGVKYNNISPILSPRFIYNASLEYNVWLFNNTLSGRYSSKSYINNENTAICPEYFTMDISTTISLKNNSLTINVNNLLDRLYYTSGYAIESIPYYFVQANRNFYLTYKMQL